MSKPAAKQKEPDYTGISNLSLIKHWSAAIKRMEASRTSGGDRQTPMFWGAGRSAVQILWRWEQGWIEDTEESRKVVAIMRERLIEHLSAREREILMRRSRG